MRGCLGAVVALGLLTPALAAGHGIVGRADLPIPDWLFIWGAGIVLLISFLALGTLWRTPQLHEGEGRAVARFPAWADAAAGALGVACFVGLVVFGLAGTDRPNDNLLPTFVYVVFWVGLVVLSALLGDLFRAVNPWRAIARAGHVALRRWAPGVARARLPYPDWLGSWPAALGLAAFGWLELVDPHGDEPRRLALLAIAYALVQVVGMALFGIERFGRGADAFGVYFELFARLSALQVRERMLRVRRPLSGLAGASPGPGTVAVLCVAIGITVFDGAQEGALWADWSAELERRFADIGLGFSASAQLTDTLGLLVGIALVGAVYTVGIAGMRWVCRGWEGSLARAFALSLVPIAFAYILAHYFSLIVYQGQALAYLVSDPLGNGADLFGTADRGIDYGLLSSETVWYVQVGALVAGHVCALAVAHDRALTLFRDPGLVVRSQAWMLGMMVGFTCLGLWLLSAANA